MAEALKGRYRPPQERSVPPLSKNKAKRRAIVLAKVAVHLQNCEICRGYSIQAEGLARHLGLERGDVKAALNTLAVTGAVTKSRGGLLRWRRTSYFVRGGNL